MCTSLSLANYRVQHVSPKCVVPYHWLIIVYGIRKFVSDVFKNKMSLP